MNYVFLIIGIITLIVGANLLVDSASKIASNLGIPASIIGLTIVAFGTSAPELAVGLTSGIYGTNQLTLGDVIGSSIINIVLVIGIASVISPIAVRRVISRRELPLSLLIQVILVAMVLTGLVLSQAEALILIIGFAIFMFWLIWRSKIFRSGKKTNADLEQDPFGFIEKEIETEIELAKSPAETVKSIVLFIVGLVMLIFGSTLIVDNAKIIAEFFGLSQEFIGLTVVAFGTSLPELTTTIVASSKNEDELAIGNIVGSNIFNVLLVLGVSASIHPITTKVGIMADLLAMLVATLLLFVPAILKKRISRFTGFIMLLFYASYISLKIAGLI